MVIHQTIQMKDRFSKSLKKKIANPKKGNITDPTPGEKNEPAAGKKEESAHTNSIEPKAKISKKEVQIPENEVRALFPMRFNKYLAYCNVGSRRNTAELIKQGKVELNGQIETNPAILVNETDQVKYQGKVLSLRKGFVYYLLNKPKGYITTTSDERKRKTVMELLKVPTEGIFPVGRLDKDTTGLLLLTNDGEMAHKLAHPSFEIKKVYKVTLDQDISERELQLIRNGLRLSDGLAPINEVNFVSDQSKKDVEINLHVGRNRIVRRIFEHLGYEVLRLDRVFYAGLTKKNIGRGFYRPLSKQEIIRLKYFDKL